MQDPHDEDFDPDFYRAFYPDLADMSAAQARDHYCDYGKSEGRFPSEKAYLRERVVADFPVPALLSGNGPGHGPEGDQKTDRTRVRHHLILGGTGRAGTTFLVQYLTACGLDTHSSRHPLEQPEEHANAGLEDLPIGGLSDLPYVVKTPWLYEFVDRLLDQKDVVIDAVILPMRDIVEAATSRVTLEMRARLANDALNEEHTRWETWGTTSGGLVYSLNPIDQARILALGFHQVVHALVKRDIPIVFLDFPRFIEDGHYLHEQLKPVLGDAVSREKALASHRMLARVDLVRIGTEIDGFTSRDKSTVPPIGFPDHDTIDRVTLFRELKHARSAAETARARCIALEETLRGDRGANIALKNRVANLDASLREVREAAAAEQRGHADDKEARLRAMTELNIQLEEALGKLQRLEQSMFWRITAPLRKLFGTF